MPTRPIRCLAVLVVGVCLASAPASAAPPKAQVLMKSVQDWWLMDEGKLVVLYGVGSIHTAEAKTGQPKLLCKTDGPVDLAPAGATVMSYKVAGKPDRWLDVRTGKLSDTKPSSAAPPKADPSKPLDLGGGKRVQVKDGQVLLTVGSVKKILMKEGGPCEVHPNRPGEASWLAITRLVDSNEDGTISRDSGDRNEVWLIDLSKPDQRIRIANAKLQNLLRGWTPDGAYLVFNRIADRPGGGVQGNLVVFRTRDKQPMQFQPGSNTNYVSYHGYAGEDRLVISFDRQVAEPKPGADPRKTPQPISQFALLNVGPKPGIRLVGQAFAGSPDAHVGPGVLLYSTLDPKWNLREVYRIDLGK